MKTRQDYLAHIAMMAEHDPAYAAKALRWYAKTMPWLNLQEVA